MTARRDSMNTIIRILKGRLISQHNKFKDNIRKDVEDD